VKIGNAIWAAVPAPRLVAGQIDLAILDPTTSLATVRAGLVKAFAVTAATHLSSAPDIPTADEAGLPGFCASLSGGRR
jgi:tripartite-type tricarboxylate transporter receptor subunit TctC